MKEQTLIHEEDCEGYPDECEFCDYNNDGWCSLCRIDVEKQEVEG